MRFICILSLLFTGCSLPFLKVQRYPFDRLVVVISYDGRGLSAITPDSAFKYVKVSVLTDYGERDFKFKKTVHFGVLSERGTYVVNPEDVGVLEAKFKGDLGRVRIKVHEKVKEMRMPPPVRITHPSADFNTWDSVKVKWKGKADYYIVRVYAFTSMHQKDEMGFVKRNGTVFDLSTLYGNGFVAVQVCPVNGSPVNREQNIKVFAISKCDERVFIVGDTSVWGGERPSPPWKDDDVLWYLLTF